MKLFRDAAAESRPAQKPRTAKKNRPPAKMASFPRPLTPMTQRDLVDANGLTVLRRVFGNVLAMHAHVLDLLDVLHMRDVLAMLHRV